MSYKVDKCSKFKINKFLMSDLRINPLCLCYKAETKITEIN